MSIVRLTTEAPRLLHPAQSMTMSSREIADLVDSRHDSVKRTIERLANQGVIAQPPLVDVQDSGGNNRTYVTQQYLFAGERGKRDSIVVVAQLSPAFTARLVDRWQELERLAAAPQFAIPQTLPEALRLAASQAEEIERQAAQLEQQRPAVEFVDRYVAAEGSKGFREVCKLLRTNEHEFRQFLLDKRVMYRLGGHLTPHAPHLDAGRFEVKTGVSANEHVYTQARFTPKGVAWVATLWFERQTIGAAV